MAKYRIIFRRSVLKEIETLGTKKDRQKIVSRIQRLASNPRPPGCEKISFKSRYRIRQGRYRIIYEIDDLDIIVTIVRVAHRKEAYR